MGFYAKYGKRALDILGSPALIILLFPIVAVLCPLIAFEIRDWPLIKQKRFGTRKYIRFYKLRTVRQDEITGKPIVGYFGGIARWYGFDEYPQLFQVFIGQLSLVGPRCLTKEDSRQLRGVLIYRVTKKGICSPGFKRRFKNTGGPAADELIYCLATPTLRGDIRIALRNVGMIGGGAGRGPRLQTDLVARRDQQVPGALPGLNDDGPAAD